ncbi:MAG: universal stress protein [Gammaproteobacteria bacterium]
MAGKINKLLCATDGSRSAQGAVAYAVQFAKELNAQLTFATVSAVAAEDTRQYASWDSVLANAVNSQLHDALHQAGKEAQAAGLANPHYAILHGRDIAKALVKFAEAEGFDQIICGSQGATGIARMVLGSVAEHIVRLAHCPVTVVR